MTEGVYVAINEGKLHELLGKGVVDFGATFHAALICIGDKLGLYKGLATGGPQTAAELAKRAGPNADGAKMCGAIRAKYPGISYEYDFAADDLNGLKPSQLVFSKLVAGKFVPVDLKVAD